MQEILLGDGDYRLGDLPCRRHAFHQNADLARQHRRSRRPVHHAVKAIEPGPQQVLRVLAGEAGDDFPDLGPDLSIRLDHPGIAGAGEKRAAEARRRGGLQFETGFHVTPCGAGHPHPVLIQRVVLGVRQIKLAGRLAHRERVALLVEGMRRDRGRRGMPVRVHAIQGEAFAVQGGDD